jgi:hypothetical protein
MRILGNPQKANSRGLLSKGARAMAKLFENTALDGTAGPTNWDTSLPRQPVVVVWAQSKEGIKHKANDKAAGYRMASV